MINGVHALIYARDAEKARAFFRDVLEWPSVDAGHGWLIFAMPPSEVGVHPIMDGDTQSHQLYLMCEDIKKAVAALEKKGIQCAPIQDAGFGIMTSFELPGGGPLGMYQPRHPIAAGKKKRKAAQSPARKGGGATKAATKSKTKARRVSGGAKTKKAAKAENRSPERKRRVSARKSTKATKPKPGAKKTKKAATSPARKGGGTKKKPARKPTKKR